MRRITISLLDEERKALHLLAKQERRDIRDQAALMIRQRLELEGYLEPRNELLEEYFDASDSAEANQV
jgi:hypothetical protein